jgi:uncharacterized protein (DUF433 family)
MIPIRSPYLEYRADGEQPEAIVLKGYRIDLVHVIELYQRGLSQEEIAHYFGDIATEAIQAAIELYATQREAVERYIADMNAAAEQRHRSTPIHPAQARLEHLLRKNKLASK